MEMEWDTWPMPMSAKCAFVSGWVNIIPFVLWLQFKDLLWIDFVMLNVSVLLISVTWLVIFILFEKHKSI